MEKAKGVECARVGQTHQKSKYRCCQADLGYENEFHTEDGHVVNEKLDFTPRRRIGHQTTNKTPWNPCMSSTERQSQHLHSARTSKVLAFAASADLYMLCRGYWEKKVFGNVFSPQSGYAHWKAATNDAFQLTSYDSTVR